MYKRFYGQSPDAVHTAEGDATALIDIVNHRYVSECFQKALREAEINAFTERRAMKRSPKAKSGMDSAGKNSVGRKLDPEKKGKKAACE